jgi:hypothetical protein
MLEFEDSSSRVDAVFIIWYKESKYNNIDYIDVHTLLDMSFIEAHKRSAEKALQSICRICIPIEEISNGYDYKLFAVVLKYGSEVQKNCAMVAIAKLEEWCICNGIDASLTDYRIGIISILIHFVQNGTKLQIELSCRCIKWLTTTKNDEIISEIWKHKGIPALIKIANSQNQAAEILNKILPCNYVCTADTCDAIMAISYLVSSNHRSLLSIFSNDVIPELITITKIGSQLEKESALDALRVITVHTLKNYPILLLNSIELISSMIMPNYDLTNCETASVELVQKTLSCIAYLPIPDAIRVLRLLRVLLVQCSLEEVTYLLPLWNTLNDLRMLITVWQAIKKLCTTTEISQNLPLWKSFKDMRLFLVKTLFISIIWWFISPLWSLIFSAHEIVEENRLERNVVSFSKVTNSEHLCVICLHRPSKVAVIPCGHRCFCIEDSQIVDKCPICRIKLTGTLQIFDV